MQRGDLPFANLVCFMDIFVHKYFSVIEGVEQHAEELWPRLRQADRNEIEFESELPVRQVLVESIKNSEIIYSLMRENEVLGMFGLGRSPRDPRGGKLWFLGSENLEAKIDLAMIRQGRNLVKSLIDRVEIAFNFVSIDNEASIRWLKWCDFEFIVIIPQYGVAKRPFWLFAKARTPELRKKWDFFFNSNTHEQLIK